VLSFLLHSGLFGLMLLMMFRVSSGASEVENRTGGIVLVDKSSKTTEYLDAGDVAEAAASQPQSSPPPASISEQLPPDLPGFAVGESPLTGVGDDLTQSDAGAESMTFGTSSNKPFGGAVTTEVFGVKGTGSRFVYVFDRSASMEDMGGKPLRAAKRQLLESMDSLGEIQQFSIIFYNFDTEMFRGDRGAASLAFAKDKTKERARRFVSGIRGEGGTDHVSALKLALSLGPDVIFLLTDAEGGFTSRDLIEISGWNKSGAVINAIQFGNGPRSQSGDSSLVAVARESRGQYIYKDVRSFRDR
jgi:hypothetical protein